MKFLFLGLLIVISSCSSGLTNLAPKQGRRIFSYSDVSGSYLLNREVRMVKKKIVSRNQLMQAGPSGKVLEKSIVVSQLGSIQDKDRRILTVRPFASEFTVWLEGKRYSSSMQINPKNKMMEVRLQSPDPKWQGLQEIAFPRGKYFCYYSQIPECLYHNRFLHLAEKTRRGMEFFIIWDGWPYIQDQLTNVGRNLFSRAVLKFDGEVKKEWRYMVEVEGQIILYHFSKAFDLVKIAWISQGITVVPPGEEIPHEDQ